MAHGNVSLYFVANLVSNVNLLMIFRALGVSVSYIFTFKNKKKAQKRKFLVYPGFYFIYKN